MANQGDCKCKDMVKQIIFDFKVPITQCIAGCCWIKCRHCKARLSHFEHEAKMKSMEMDTFGRVMGEKMSGITRAKDVNLTLSRQNLNDHSSQDPGGKQFHSCLNDNVGKEMIVSSTNGGYNSQSSSVFRGEPAFISASLILKDVHFIGCTCNDCKKTN